MTTRPCAPTPPRAATTMMRYDKGIPACGRQALVIPKLGGGELVVCPHCDGPAAEAARARVGA